VSLVLARTEQTVVAVTGIRVFPTGFGFTLNLRLRNLAPQEQPGFWPSPEFGFHGGRTVPADAFRLTVEFADGRSVNNLDPAPSDPEVPAFEQPMLSSGPGTGLVGSGSSPDRWGWDMDYPGSASAPAGAPGLVCVWPERGIPPSRVEVDGRTTASSATAVTGWSSFFRSGIPMCRDRRL
jgi:hypothetical protein